MLRILSLIVLCSAIFAASGPSSSFAQQAAPAIPDSLSLDSLTTPPEPLDESLFVLPENATAQELLTFVEELSAKIPEPTSQIEMLQFTEAMTKVCQEVADKILAMSDATEEERDQAVQLKVVALTAKSRTDEAAVEELTQFVDGLVQNAKDDAAKVKAYQLKLQVLVSKAKDESVLDQVDALADEILALEGDELKVLGLEIKAQQYLSRSQQDAGSLDAFLTFMNDYLANAELSQRVLERAQEIKLYALLAASQKTPEKTTELDQYFDEVLAKELSAESKSAIYQLRMQSLMSDRDQNADKILAVAETLLKEETSELQSLGRAAKGSILVSNAQADAAKIDVLFQFADEILANAADDAVAKEQGQLMKIQAYAIRSKEDAKANDELIAFVDKILADDQPTAQFLNQLAQIKLQVLLHAMLENEEQAPTTEQIAAVEAALDQFADLDELKQMSNSIRGIVYLSKIQNIAENKGSIDDLNAVLSDLKKSAEADPAMIVFLFESSESVEAINQIGQNNKNPKLFEDILAEFIDFCKNSPNEQIQTSLAYLEDLQKLNSLVGKTLPFEGIVIGSEEDKENKTFKSSEYAGKIYLIDVWSTNNPAYFDLVEEIKNVYKEYNPKGLEIVGVNTDSNTQILNRAIEVLSIPWTVVSTQLTLDAKKTIPDEFAAAKSGTMILVGKDGKVLAVSSDLETIRQKLAELFK